MSSNNLTDDSLESISAALIQKSSLKVLILMGNQFGGDGMSTLKNALGSKNYAAQLSILKIGEIHSFEPVRFFDFISNGAVRAKSLKYLQL